MKRKVLFVFTTISLALLLTSNFSVQLVGASAGLAAYWKFDESSGATAYDSSGNGNDGTLNGPYWVSGKYGSALSFDGIDYYVEVLDSPVLNPPLITVMAWVNFRGFPDPWEYDWNPDSMIVAKGTSDQVEGYYGLYQIYREPEIFHFVLTENNRWYSVNGTTHIVEGEWYHVAGTYDGSTLRLYVNGVLEDEETINVTRTEYTENLQIGALRFPNYEYWTNGTIDEVKIFDRALTKGEVLTHMKSPPIGGISIPVNKLELLAPYIGLTILLAVAVVTVGYVKKRKRDTESIS